jgi:hypothetical protein
MIKGEGIERFKKSGYGSLSSKARICHGSFWSLGEIW